VAFPLFFHVCNENTSRLPLWCLFGVHSFEEGKVVEYSACSPFFRLTTFSHGDLNEPIGDGGDDMRQVGESQLKAIILKSLTSTPL